MNKYIIKLMPTFESDLENIYRYIFFILKEPIVATKFYDNIIHKVFSLQYFPERNKKISNYLDPSRNLRKLLIHNYIVIYEVNNTTRASFYFTYFS